MLIRQHEPSTDASAQGRPATSQRPQLLGLLLVAMDMRELIRKRLGLQAAHKEEEAGTAALHSSEGSREGDEADEEGTVVLASVCDCGRCQEFVPMATRPPPQQCRGGPGRGAPRGGRGGNPW